MSRFNPTTEKYYLGEFLSCGIGYSKDVEVRSGCASGGITSTFLIYLLETRQIDGALVSRCVVKDGQLNSETWIATTKEEILKARTSVYFDFPLLKHLDKIKNFEGKIAIVGLPCQISALKEITAKNTELREKIKVTIGLFCGHASNKTLIDSVLDKMKINLNNVESFSFRKGHWRGQMYIYYKNNEVKTFPFQRFSLYQNLFVDCAPRCFNCTDHTAEFADLSMGDVWDQKYKELDIKHNAYIIRSKFVEENLSLMKSGNMIEHNEVPSISVYKAQKRSLHFHKHIKARAALFNPLLKTNITYDKNLEKASFPDYISALMLSLIIKISKLCRSFIFKIPKKILKAYLYCIKLFQGL